MRGKKLAFCRGCLARQKTLKWVILDAAEIAEKMRAADAIAFATPVYYCETSKQMVMLFDRVNPLFPSKYSFRDIYMLSAAAEDNEAALEKAIEGLQAGSIALKRPGLRAAYSQAALME